MQIADAARFTLCAAMAAGCALLCGQVSARTPDAPWFTELEVTSEFPMSAGGRLVVEAPYRVRIGATIGWLPKTNVDLLNGLATSVGAYDQAVADLISISVEDSLSTRFDLGWRPFAHRGFYALVGYRWLGFSGTVTGRQIAQIIDEEPPSSARAYTASSTLHMIETELGWQWYIAGDFTLRTSLGFAATIGASVEVEALYTIDDYEDIATARLTNAYQSYGFTPLIGFGAGYRFQ